MMINNKRKIAVEQISVFFYVLEGCGSKFKAHIYYPEWDLSDILMSLKQIKLCVIPSTSSQIHLTS